MPLYPLLRINSTVGCHFVDPNQVVAIRPPSKQDLEMDRNCRSVVIFHRLPEFRSSDSSEDLANRYAECIRSPMVQLAERVAGPEPWTGRAKWGPIVATIDRAIPDSLGGYYAVIPAYEYNNNPEVPIGSTAICYLSNEGGLRFSYSGVKS